MDKFIQNIKQNDIDCDQVDIQEMERFGQQVAQNLQDMVLNVDLTKAQFDFNTLYEEAEKIGITFEDFSEFKCDGLKCLGNKSMKDMDDVLNGHRRFQEKMIKQIIQQDLTRDFFMGGYIQNLKPNKNLSWQVNGRRVEEMSNLENKITIRRNLGQF